MTVRELIEELEELPGNYQVFYETGDGYGSAYYAHVERLSVNHKTKEVELL